VETIIKDKIKTFFEKLQINIEKLDIITEEGNIFNVKIKTNDS